MLQEQISGLVELPTDIIIITGGELNIFYKNVLNVIFLNIYVFGKKMFFFTVN